MKMNLGAGKDVRGGWVNVDAVDGPGINLVLDLDQPKPFELAPDDSVDEFYVSHLIEHLHYPLPLLEAMWNAATPGAKAIFRTPYGSSDNADEDPTHVRRLFLHSWDYFGQPIYTRCDYGYRGDWKIERVTLICNPDRCADTPMETMKVIERERNVVQEMIAELVAIKPARPQVWDDGGMHVDIVKG